MVSSTMFSLSGNAPVLLMRQQAGPGGALHLTVEGASQALPAFFALDGAPTGVPVAQLFPHDREQLDEWMEFIVKTRSPAFHKKGGFAGGDLTSIHMLQFFQGVKKWAITTLMVDMAGKVVCASFKAPQNLQVPTGVRHYMSVKQNLTLGDFMDKGGNWEIDLPSETIFLSRKLASALEFGDEAMVVPLSRFLGAIHPDDLPAVQTALENVTAVQAPVRNRGVVPSGATLHFNSFAIPGYDENGKLARIVGRSQNITEKAETARQLEVSSRRFRAIVENSQDLLAVMDTEGVILYASPAAMGVLGYAPEAIEGQSFFHYLAHPGREKARIQADFAKILRRKAPAQAEYHFRRANGQVACCLVSASAILDEKGEVAEVAAALRDITAEKEHEENFRYMSTHDALTGVHNRFYFERELERIQMENLTDVGLIIADLNGLKLVNDAFGHSRGDGLLGEAATLLSGIFPGPFDLSRIGGDEFAVFVYDCTAEELEGYGQAIRERCALTASRLPPLSISWGSAHRAGPETSAQAMYRQAEGRLYNNKLRESRSMHSQVLASLKEALKSRNVETSDHMQRMENMVMALGTRLGLPGSEFDRLLLLASMHDIGKVGIPDNVINKPGSLSEEEWAVMRTHSEVGSRIAMTSQELSSIAHEIRCHHERWDGGGYPGGQTGDQIPLLSRIISVVDTYDVMTHDRVYRKAVGHAAAIAELRRCAGSQFDPHIVALFLDIFGALSQEEMRSFIQSDPHALKASFREGDSPLPFS